MGMQRNPGFTIIETVLFLAVTGLLMVAVLASTGTNIQIQRYKDSVSTLQNYIREQYSAVDNVSNDQTTEVSCNNAVVSETGATKPRGQSDCYVMGRYITIINDEIRTVTVVGEGAASINANDIAAMQSFRYGELPDSVATRTMEWGSRIAWPKSGLGAKNPTTPRSIAILILKSPVSGLKYTFTSDNVNASLASMIVSGNTNPGQTERRLCIDGNGMFDGGMRVVIGAYASNPGAIEVRSNEMGDGSQC